ncbi:Prolyl oligopeptidase family protein [compost metagenome]
MAGWGETGQASIGDFALSPQAYVEASPLYKAGAIRTPALLIESDLDTPRMGALFSALYRRDREAGLVTYYGEGHTYFSPGNLRDLHGRILDWLARYLGPP